MQTFSSFYKTRARGRSFGGQQLPKLESQESSVDMTLLDVMNMEDFLSHLKTRTDNSWKELWRETVILTEQLKASRELLTIGANLLSHRANHTVLNRFIEVTRVLLGAEKVLIMEADSTGRELIVTHALDEKMIGRRTSISSGIEGDVLLKKTTINVNDVKLDPRYNPLLLEGNGGESRTRNMLCAPILCDGASVGVIVAANKISAAFGKKGADFASLSFAPNEVLLLSYIAANIGTALKQTSLADDTGARRDVMNLQNDFNFQHLVDLLHLYNKIDAERVSIFVYSPVSKSLVCVVSQDIKGLALPHDKGLAGLAFTAMRTLNVADARKDDRHYKDIDRNSGFTTRSVLCAPIITEQGVSLGVVMAINKKTGAAFTAADEMQIQSICAAMLSLLLQQQLPPPLASGLNGSPNGSEASQSHSLSQNDVRSRGGADKEQRGEELFESGAAWSTSVSSEFSQSLAQMALSSSVAELVGAAEEVVLKHTDFDVFRVFVADKGDRLVRVSAAAARRRAMTTTTEKSSSSPALLGELTLAEQAVGEERALALDAREDFALDSVSACIRQALQPGAALSSSSSSMREYRGEEHDGESLLASVEVKHAFVVPIGERLFSFAPGPCVAVFGHATPSRSTDARSKTKMQLVAATLSSAASVIAQRVRQEESATQLRRQYHLLNNTLGALQDLVIILDAEGKLVCCNKPLEELLGLQHLANLDALAGVVVGSGESRKHHHRSSFTGRSSPTPSLDPATGAVREGMHFSQWLSNANSPELCRDIQNALLRGESRALEAARLTSSKYPEGVSVDYHVVAIANPHVAPSPSPTHPAGGAHIRRSLSSTLPTFGPSSTSARSLKKASSSATNNSSSDAALPDIPENNAADLSAQSQIVVVTIHINKRPSMMDFDEAVPSVGACCGGAGAVGADAVADVMKSASSGVDSAASILAAIRNNYVLDAESESQIKQLTNSLVQASRRLSIRQSTFSQSAINLALQNATLMLVSPSVSLPENVFEWTFDVLQIKDAFMLTNIIGHFFETLFDLESLHVDSGTLARFIAEVGRHYHDRPFHNLQHATCVTHFCFMLIRATQAAENLKAHQVFSILLSAVVHDVDHPGNTNLFEINSGSELAIRYNDQSVLENHHCSTAFRLMRKAHMQVLTTMEKSVSVEIRKTIIACVMATDMAVHFELIDETKKRAQNGWNFEESKDQSLLGKILLHAADLSNPVRPFHMTQEWARRISIEFNDQVQREEALGMPVLGFMRTPDEKAFCKNEMGFSSFVVAPMWRTLSLCYPELGFLVQQLDENLVTWKGTLERLQQEEQQQQEEQERQEKEQQS